MDWICRPEVTPAAGPTQRRLWEQEYDMQGKYPNQGGRSAVSVKERERGNMERKVVCGIEIFDHD
jgi:hypothetical protein